MILAMDQVSFDFDKYSDILPKVQEWRGNNAYGFVKCGNSWQIISSKFSRYKISVPINISPISTDFIEEIDYVNAKKEASRFFSQICEHDATTQIWKLSERFNEMIADGNFKQIDNYLECINIQSINPQAALSVLVLTNRVKRKLHFREDVYQRISELSAFTDPKTLKWIQNLA